MKVENGDASAGRQEFVLPFRGQMVQCCENPHGGAAVGDDGDGFARGTREEFDERLVDPAAEGGKTLAAGECHFARKFTPAAEFFRCGEPFDFGEGERLPLAEVDLCQPGIEPDFAAGRGKFGGFGGAPERAGEDRFRREPGKLRREVPRGGASGFRERHVGRADVAPAVFVGHFAVADEQNLSYLHSHTPMMRRMQNTKVEAAVSRSARRRSPDVSSARPSPQKG